MAPENLEAAVQAHNRLVTRLETVTQLGAVKRTMSVPVVDLYLTLELLDAALATAQALRLTLEAAQVPYTPASVHVAAS